MANLSARSHSIKKWTCVLVVLVAFQLLVNTFLGPLLGPMLLGLSIQFWMGYKTISYNCCNKQPDGCEELAPPLLPKDASKQPAAAGKSERLYYLDNLKVFLTVMVIVHHVTCMFVGGGWVWNFNSYTADNYSNYIKNFGEWLLTVDQSYFMCMFFFISGYFTPTSLDRKGRHAFLKDKFKRLGIPYVLVSIMWFPLCMFTSFLMIKNIGSESVNGENISDVYFFAAIPNPGPLWFVGWLCIFNTIYASVDHSEPKVMACPTPFRLFAMSVPMMVLQILVNVIGLGSFLFMPITIGSLPFDIMWFYGGCVAKRNKWLEAGTEGGLVEIMNRCVPVVVQQSKAIRKRCARALFSPPLFSSPSLLSLFTRYVPQAMDALLSLLRLPGCFSGRLVGRLRRPRRRSSCTGPSPFGHDQYHSGRLC